MEVRFYRYHFTHLNTLSRRNVQHISGYFMTKDAWVFEIRLHALKSVEVGATDADLSNIHQCFCRIGSGLIRLDELQHAGGVAIVGIHLGVYNYRFEPLDNMGYLP